MAKLPQLVYLKRIQTVWDVVLLMFYRKYVHEKDALKYLFEQNKRKNETGFSVDKGFDKFYSQFKTFKSRLPYKDVISSIQFYYYRY